MPITKRIFTLQRTSAARMQQAKAGVAGLANSRSPQRGGWTGGAQLSSARAAVAVLAYAESLEADVDQAIDNGRSSVEVAGKKLGCRCERLGEPPRPARGREATKFLWERICAPNAAAWPDDRALHRDLWQPRPTRQLISLIPRAERRQGFLLGMSSGEVLALEARSDGGVEARSGPKKNRARPGSPSPRPTPSEKDSFTTAAANLGEIGQRKLLNLNNCFNQCRIHAIPLLRKNNLLSKYADCQAGNLGTKFLGEVSIRSVAVSPNG